MNGSGLVARRQAELRLRVGEHLDPGEALRAALWVARPSDLPLISRITQWQGAPQGLLGLGGTTPPADPHSGLDGPAGSTAGGLDRHLPEHTTAAALALTDARLLLLLVSGAPTAPAPAPPRGLLDRIRAGGRRVFGRAGPVPLPPLSVAWQCPRAVLSGVVAGDPQGWLALRFADGSGLSVVAPALLATPFAEAARH
ncbi:hypothetical protein [Actinoplanes siamensis]|uniref:Uncharacterized protein n=1 Tax=Actinoplanes siamensis TaxID=1223317 RepID=A0A919N4F9_9ACTN|nr:hypothetical protein [Actinoplanes siamensis]GIF04203.1 hypothetical protein Asi03nite_17410 [Actinoplanes siamensis]